MKALSKHWGFVYLLVACFAPYALGQQTLATVTGTVMDAAGGIVAGAQVTVKNTDTNIEKKLTSNDAGLYEASYLIPGHYEVSVEKPGFKRFVAPDILVQAGQIVRVDPKLEIGEVTTEVMVRDAAPAITTEASNITSMRNNQQLEDAPLNTRGSWDSYLFTFVGMMPGAQPSDASFDISFNGTRPYQNQFSVDGIATTSTLYGNIIGPANPSMDFVHEVKVDSNSNSAEFQAPASVNVVTRSGTNTLHGSAYEYYTTSGFNARNPFQSQNNRNLLHDYGASIGGPIIKDRTFFFGDFENFSNYLGSPVNIVVPTPAMRNGNFSAFNGVIKNPFTGQPFPNNTIPENMLNPTSLKIQDRFFPMPTNLSNNIGSPNYSTSLPADQEKYMFDVRIDHQIASNNAFYGRFDFARMPNHSRDSPLPAIPQRAQERNTRNFIVSDTHTFSPTVINEARFGMTRGHNNYYDPISGQEVVSQLGLTGLAPLGPDVFGVPQMSISGVQGLSVLPYANNLEMIFQLQDSVSWQKGRHTFKFGGEALKNYAAVNFTSPTSLLGNTRFTGVFTGNAYADFLLGLPLSASVVSGGTDREYAYNHQFSLYAQDSFRVSTRLTLNYGLRWDADEPYIEKYDRYYNFDPVTARVVVPNENTFKSLFPAFVKSGIVPIVTAAQAGYPSTLVNPDRNNFAPRFGFAYLLTSDQKTVLRGGYGIYYERSTDALWMAMQSGAPFNGTLSNSRNEVVNGVPTWQLPAIFPSTFSAQTGSDFSAINPNLRNPYTQQWNLTVERQLSASTGLRISYLGTRGTKLVWVRDLNQVPESDIPYDPGRRPYPTLNSVAYVDNGANSIYHGLNVTATRRWSRGLMFESTYTWAKNITDNESGWQGGGFATNTYNRSYDRGNVSWTRRHRMTNTIIWELPFGHGKKFLTSGGWLNAIAGGWQISAVNVLQTGSYFTPMVDTTYDMGNTNTFEGRPDRLKDGNLDSSQRSLTHWFDTSLGGPGAAWALPPANRRGNAGYDILEGPGTINLDLGLFKNFDFRERLRMQLQLTATNALNHFNWGNPDNFLTNSTAGVISSEQTWEGAQARTLRIGIRFMW